MILLLSKFKLKGAKGNTRQFLRFLYFLNSSDVDEKYQKKTKSLAEEDEFILTRVVNLRQGWPSPVHLNFGPERPSPAQSTYNFGPDHFDRFFLNLTVF